MDNLNINIEELEKQRKEAILKSGQYCLAEVIIGKGDQEPIAHIETRSVSSLEIAGLIISLEEMAKTLIKKDPAAYIFAKQMRTETNIIEKPNEEE